MKICIVTPDIVGPIKNGGIGTHATTLSRLLKGHELTILFTSAEEKIAHKGWEKGYEAQGIRIVRLDGLKNLDPFKEKAPWEEWFFERSRRVFEYLNTQEFDVVHFQEWHANGFFSIRAKRTGIGLANTRLTVTMHSPSEWSRQGMQMWPGHVLPDMKLNLAERYCCEHAEVLIAPSQHMFDWAESQGWQLPESKQVLPCSYLRPESCPKTVPIDPSHVIFFGRLETRKGLGIFLEGLKRYLSTETSHGIQQVSFLGKEGEHLGEKATKLIEQFAEHFPAIVFKPVTDLDSESALAYIAESGGIVYIPSLLDNCPYTVVECIERGFPFFAAKTGGIPELASEKCLFEPTREGVVDALDRRGLDFRSFQHLYSSQKANQDWLALHESLVNTKSPAVECGDAPLVSICVAYYNHPDYLPQLLASIDALEYPNFEVVLANDGSSDSRANEVFAGQKTKYARPNWHFLQKDNGGVGHARNFAASQAKGDYLVFMDADNLAVPGMLQTMVHGMQVSGADCLTCYFIAFASEEPPGESPDIKYIFRPVGGRSPFGFLENSYGDANCIIKRSIFDAVGGFTTQRNTSNEDWEILLNLVMAGYDVDIIPKELFWYRHLESGFSRITNSYSNHQRVLSKVLADCPPLQRELINNFAIPIYYQFLELERRLGKSVVQDTKVPLHKHIYRFYRRVIGDPKYQKRRK